MKLKDPARVHSEVSELGLGITRLRAMKLMKFPSGDHVTVSGNTHERSGGMRFRRNSPSELKRSMRKHRTWFICCAVKSKHAPAVRRHDCAQQRIVLSFAGEEVCDGSKLVFLIVEVGIRRRDVGRESISEISRGHVAQHTWPHVLSFDDSLTSNSDDQREREL